MNIFSIFYVMIAFVMIALAVVLSFLALILHPGFGALVFLSSAILLIDKSGILDVLEKKVKR